MHGCYVDRDLAFGSFGTDVSCLQEHLGRVARTRGAQGTSRLYEGPVTGHFGEKTQEAVAAWQVRRLWRLGRRRRAADSVCVCVCEALSGCEGLGGGGHLVILTRKICFVPFGVGASVLLPVCIATRDNIGSEANTRAVCLISIRGVLMRGSIGCPDPAKAKSARLAQAKWRTRCVSPRRALQEAAVVGASPVLYTYAEGIRRCVHGRCVTRAFRDFTHRSNCAKVCCASRHCLKHH